MDSDTLHQPTRKNAGTVSQELDHLYDNDYFSGRTSGYGSGGYRQDHPDWDAWLDIIGRIQPRGRLVDLGCAYGFLVDRARQRGYRAAGLDISSYALSQEAALRPLLVRADLHQLPLASQSADIVALFDVLEHLHKPLDSLREAARILAPEGLLVGATPDPVFFDRVEYTHVNERPPSFWLAAMRGLGLEVRYRFSGEAYNFQFMAAPAGSEVARRLAVFQHDYIEDAPDFPAVEGDALDCLPRSGWGPLQDGARLLARSPALLYLNNPADTPLRLTIRFRAEHCGGFATLRLRLDSLVLLDVNLAEGSKKEEKKLPSVILPAGGHHLYFELSPRGPEVRILSLSIEAEPAQSEQLALTLPFDLYQRYRLAGDLCRVLAPRTILDVGGYLGDVGGHLAVSSDFLAAPGGSVQSTDLRQLDWPHHRPAQAWKQPFSDGSFELVVSLDVLEHLPQEVRSAFLAELDRVSERWTIVGGPYSSPEVVEAEQILAAGLLRERAFLEEHQEQGLPELEEVLHFYESRGRTVYRIPNGYLPRWKAMQALTQRVFASDCLAAIQGVNQLYNSEWYRHDQAAPSYRTLLLICGDSLNPAQEAALHDLLSADPGPPLSELLGDSRFLELERLILEAAREQRRHLHDVQFLINERQKLIGLQQRELDWLKEELENTPLWKLARRRWRNRRSRQEGDE